MAKGRSADYLIHIRAQNKQLKDKLKETQARMREHKNFMSRISKELKSLAMGAFGVFGAAAIVQQGVKTLVDFEFQMSKVKAISGATAEEFKKLEKNARDVGAVSKFTATEIGKLQEELARLGFSADEIINMTDAARKLATVADAELGEAAKVLGQQINAFNLSAEDAGRVANVMAESFTKSALDLETFKTAMGNVGAVAFGTGQSIEKTAAQIAKLVDNGIDASTAGTQMRQVLLEVTKQGLNLDEVLEEVANSTDVNATAMKYFETRTIPVITTLARTRGQVELLNTQFSDMNMEMNGMVDIMEDNLLTDFQKLSSAIQEVTLKGGFLNGVLRGLTQSLTTVVNEGVFLGFERHAKNGKELANALRGLENPMGALNKLYIDGKIHSEAYRSAHEELLKTLNKTADTKDPFNVNKDPLDNIIKRDEERMKKNKILFKEFGSDLATSIAAGFDAKIREIDDFDLDALLEESMMMTGDPQMVTKIKHGIGDIYKELESVTKEAQDSYFNGVNENFQKGVEQSTKSIVDAIAFQNQVLELQLEQIAFLWSQAGQAVGTAIDGMFDALEAAVAGKDLSQVFKNLFVSLTKQAGQAFTRAGIQDLAAAATADATAALLSGGTVPKSPLSPFLRSRGKKNLSIGIGLGATGAIAAGLFGGSGGNQGGGNVSGAAREQVSIPAQITLRVSGKDLVSVINTNERFNRG
jgi:hypothetical protein